MIRRGALVLVLLSTVLLGRAPCCVLNLGCCGQTELVAQDPEEYAEDSGCSCCREEPTPAGEREHSNSDECDCFDLHAVLAVGAAPDSAAAALSLCARPTATRLASSESAALLNGTRAPPAHGVALTLPLLL